jgi:hypothetical protein
MNVDQPIAQTAPQTAQQNGPMQIHPDDLVAQRNLLAQRVLDLELVVAMKDRALKEIGERNAALESKMIEMAGNAASAD